jgi:hypothetical protein
MALGERTIRLSADGLEPPAQKGGQAMQTTYPTTDLVPFRQAELRAEADEHRRAQAARAAAQADHESWVQRAREALSALGSAAAGPREHATDPRAHRRHDARPA